MATKRNFVSPIAAGNIEVNRPSKLEKPDFKVSTIEYNVETESKWTAGDDDNYFYELLENKD